MKYASIDIETTGLNPETCQTIEVAIVLDDLRDPQPIEKLPKFQSYIIHPTYAGEPTALAMHQQIFERISKRVAGFNYNTPDGVAYAAANFLRTNGFLKPYPDKPYTDRPINVAGKNFASFDRPFLEKLGFTKYIKFVHRVIDPAILYYDLAMDERLPDTATCMSRAGIRDSVGSHDALEDAINVIRLLRKRIK